MTEGQKHFAQRKAIQVFEEWNDVTGFVQPFTSYYYEIIAVIEDAVEIGAMVALDIKFKIVDGKPKEIK